MPHFARSTFVPVSQLTHSPVNLEPPLCLRVDNTVTALPQIARSWRRKLDIPALVRYAAAWVNRPPRK